MAQNNNNNDYNSDQFVDREEAIDLVMGQVGEMHVLLGQEMSLHPSRRVIYFTGPAQQGKTWLLKELEHRLSQDGYENVVPIRLELSHLAVEGKGQVDLGVEEYLENVQKKCIRLINRSMDDANNEWKSAVLFDAMPGMKLSYLVRRLDKIFVFLLDEISEVKPEYLLFLFNQLLGRLFEEPNVLYVIAGRLTHGVILESLYLRPVDEKITFLPEFGLEETAEQVEKLNPGMETQAKKNPRSEQGFTWVERPYCSLH